MPTTPSFVCTNLYHLAASLNNGAATMVQSNSGTHDALDPSMDLFKLATKAVHDFTMQDQGEESPVKVHEDGCYRLASHIFGGQLNTVRNNQGAHIVTLLLVAYSPSTYCNDPLVSAAVASAVILFNIGITFQRSALSHYLSMDKKATLALPAISDAQAALLLKAQVMYQKALSILESLSGSFHSLHPAGKAACDFVAMGGLANLGQNAYLMADFKTSETLFRALSLCVYRVEATDASSYAEHAEDILAFVDWIRFQSAFVTTLLFPLPNSSPAA